MEKKILVTGIILFLIGSVLSVSGNVNIKKTTMPLSSGNTLYVGGSGSNNYTSIQGAVNDAYDGDTIFVYDDSSPYIENIVVKKSINLIGENRDTTVIDGGRKKDVVRLWSEFINFTGFTVQNSGSGNTGIFLLSDYINVFGNRLVQNDRDICLSHSNNVVTDNILFGNGFYVSYHYGNQNTISDNYIHEKPLVYLEGEKDIVVDVNAGQIVLVDCDNVTIHNQEINGLLVGIQLRGSTNCLISNNYISHAFCGIELYHRSNNNVLSDNIILNSTAFGIHFQNSSRNTILDNTITGCVGGSAIYIEYYSTFNIISNNTLMFNNQAGVHVSSRNNIILGNNISSNEYIGVALYNADSTYEDDSARNCIIQGNTISDCSTAISSRSLHNLSIKGNILYNNLFGIKNYNCKDCVILDNNIFNNNWEGILVNSSENISIIGNFISADGIRLEDSYDNLVCYNDIEKSFHGILFIRSSGNSVSFNNFYNNGIGVNLVYSSYNDISYNNFEKNSEKNAFFEDCDDNFWDANFWDRLRFFPYHIFGSRTVEIPLFGKIKVVSIEIDMNPAKSPYDIRD